MVGTIKVRHTSRHSAAQPALDRQKYITPSRSPPPTEHGRPDTVALENVSFRILHGKKDQESPRDLSVIQDANNPTHVQKQVTSRMKEMNAKQDHLEQVEELFNQREKFTRPYSTGAALLTLIGLVHGARQARREDGAGRGRAGRAVVARCAVVREEGCSLAQWFCLPFGHAWDSTVNVSRITPEHTWPVWFIGPCV